MKLVDMHCDTISQMLERRRAGEEVLLRENDGHLDLLRMKKSGYLLQNFALFVNNRKCEDAWKELCNLYQIYREELASNEDMIAPVLCYEDIAVNQGAGKMSAMLTVEEGAVCKGSLRKLHQLHDMGVRMVTLTWNYPNELGYPNLDAGTREKQSFEEYFYTGDITHGLTDRGREFVVEMERLSMIVDVSHLSDAGFYDVLESTRKPFVASHSNARQICRSARNLTDDMIRRLAERGGCMGLNYYADFLQEKSEKVNAVKKEGLEKHAVTESLIQGSMKGELAAIVRHAAHIVNIGGIEVLGLGSDFDGIDTPEELQGAQSMELLWEALQEAGFMPSALDKIFGENVLRVYRDCLT